MIWTCSDMARQYLGTAEIPGGRHNPLVVGWLQMFGRWVQDDETAWCGAFAGFVAHSMGFALPGPEKWRALQARYWLTVGQAVDLKDAHGNCVVIFKRGRGSQPGPDVLNASGHVAIFDHQAEARDGQVAVIGGNQSNRVTRAYYSANRVLGVRKLRSNR